MTGVLHRLHGGVIIDESRRTHGIIRLLSYYVRGKIDLTYYEHANQIETERPHQFVIVLTHDDLNGVVRHYNAVQTPVPVIVHLDRPEILGAMDYENLFPGIEIAPVEQSSLGDKDVTLRIGMFQEVIEALEARC